MDSLGILLAWRFFIYAKKFFYIREKKGRPRGQQTESLQIPELLDPGGGLSTVAEALPVLRKEREGRMLSGFLPDAVIIAEGGREMFANLRTFYEGFVNISPGPSPIGRGEKRYFA